MTATRRIVLAFFLCGIFFTAGIAQGTDFFFTKLSIAAIDLTRQRVQYDPAYFAIPYPNGDVPLHKGVCTDVIIRAYRKLSIDLQKEVHEDMKANFASYPNNWGLTKPDKNIDHRRVPNLMTFFSRLGTILKKSNDPSAYEPGDIVTWDLGKGVGHIGIVVDKKSDDGKRFLVVHNIGNGQELSDCLFQFAITGHYRYSK
jgi:uncharacterized protein YijF (DUF1287 family)